MTVQGYESIDALASAIRAGDRRALARGLSLLESSKNDDRAVAHTLLGLVHQPHVASRRIGISGAPGVGKSTFIETFGVQQIERGHRVAVLAVDPTSKRSGGSILGDKVRMQHLSVHDNAFVRPSPSRLSLGGVTSTTREAIVLCEAAGFDTILIETVGVGQSEIDVADMTDLFLLLVLPTAGDDVQAIKRGVMEVADVVIVTKSDVDPTASSRAEAQYRSALRLMLPSQAQWNSRVCSVSAISEQGLDAVHDVVDAFFHAARATAIADRRRDQRLSWFRAAFHERFLRVVEDNPTARALVEQRRQEVEDGRLVPSVAVDAILATVTLTVQDT